MKLLRQSLFAKRDYEGLSEKGKQLLSKKKKRGSQKSFFRKKKS